MPRRSRSSRSRRRRRRASSEIASDVALSVSAAASRSSVAARARSARYSVLYGTNFSLRCGSRRMTVKKPSAAAFDFVSSVLIQPSNSSLVMSSG